ncbi:MAG: hypothetical protein KKH92_03035 [Firmicutes bacterium]|nr:hypothetical protein [Bacillota bacterium]
MIKSKIKEFISANTLFSKTKLWVPIVFTAIFLITLIEDCLDSSNDILQMSSYILFKVIYIVSIWIVYYSSKDYSKINDYIVDNEKNIPSIFDEDQESTFQKILEKLSAYILILILALLIFEVFRLIYDLFHVENSIKIIIFVALLIFSLFAFIGCLIKFKQFITFLKSISIAKS